MENFDKVQFVFEGVLKEAFATQEVDTIEKKYASFTTLGDSEKKGVLDQALRDHLLSLANESDNVGTLERYVALVVELSRKDLCSPSMPVALLSDLFEIFTIEQSEKMFNFVEANVSVWKEELFFGPCKNNLLRMCNDLLRRLSRSQNTVFRGRILLFLARFFPFSERSGLNVVSEFNLENVTELLDEAAALELKEFNMDLDEEEEEGVEKKLKIDYNLYSKFLTLQDFFRSPTQCYNKVRWRVFISSANDVLTAFNSFKLQKDNYDSKSAQELTKESANNSFFAKYLTNPKLLELQLSDANFRRSLLIQFLIVFQYLTGTVKFKLDSYEVTTEQSDWIKEQTELVYKLLAETPSGSSHFAQTVKNILNREEMWNNWKNEGCPEFRAPAIAADETEPIRPKQKLKRKNVADFINDAAKHGKYYMGHPELTKLWNINPNNLEACKVKERDFLPKMDEYFEEAIEQLDPSAGVEDQYKKVNDGNFGWRALRLLAHRSPYFFTYTNNPINKLPDYLTQSLNKLVKDRPQQATDEEEEVVIKQEQESQEENIEPEETSQTNNVVQRISEEILNKVAQIVGDGWKKLAAKLVFDEEIVKLIEEKNSSEVKRAEAMLKRWSEEDEDATVENLEYTLEGLGFIDAVQVLNKKDEEKVGSQEVLVVFVDIKTPKPVIEYIDLESDDDESVDLSTLQVVESVILEQVDVVESLEQVVESVDLQLEKIVESTDSQIVGG